MKSFAQKNTAAPKSILRWTVVLTTLFVPLTARLSSGDTAATSSARSTPDPYAHVSGAPDPKADPAVESLRFPEAAWGPLPLSYLKKEPHYIKDWRDHIVMPEPPSNTSARTRAELDYLLTIQEHRTAKDKERIDRERVFGNFYIGQCLGPKFTEQNLPATAVFLENVKDDAAAVIFNTKKRLPRTRPHTLESRIHPSIEVPPWPAWPNGHSALAHTLAFVLQELAPSQGEALRKEAFMVGWDRELAGVHYPSDTAMGILLARQITDLLLSRKEFRDHLEEVRREWEAKGLVKK